MCREAQSDRRSNVFCIQGKGHRQSYIDIYIHTVSINNDDDNKITISDNTIRHWLCVYVCAEEPGVCLLYVSMRVGGLIKKLLISRCFPDLFDYRWKFAS